MMRIGVLGASDIARRRMIPAINKSETVEYAGVAIATREEWGESVSAEEYAEMYSRKQEKAAEFEKLFGGRTFRGYEAMLQSGEIDAVYIPLPPSLHFKWAQRALQCGKHVLLEKPFTIRHADTQELLRLAQERGLAVLENYGFVYHEQLLAMKRALEEGELGELRLIRAAFAFPYRGGDDFRYHADLGGGALWDCGGYTLKAAELFMRGEIQICAQRLHYRQEHDVDMYGSVTLEDEDQCTAQLFFGMDNAYVCKLELWGNKGCIFSERAFTAPDNLEVPVILRNAAGEKRIVIPADDQFLKAVNMFAQAAREEQAAAQIREDILRHSILLDKFVLQA